MAFTPTDPTKAEVRTTQVGTQLEFDFYIPRGAKGEPGGIVSGTDLLTTDLNSIKTPGVYRQPNTPGALLNYPQVLPGVLIVHERIAPGSFHSVVQEYQPVNSAQTAAVFFKRYFYSNSTWGPWKAYASQRVDNTAGRAIYTWDDVNGREQLTYGDTGSRNITDLVDATKWTVSIAKLRRVGAQVELRLGLTPLAGVSGTVQVFAQLPAGFQNQHSFNTVAVDNTNVILPIGMSFSGGPLSINGVVSGRGLTVMLGFQTLNPWPTTLPGTADGTIPNL